MDWQGVHSYVYMYKSHHIPCLKDQKKTPLPRIMHPSNITLPLGPIQAPKYNTCGGCYIWNFIRRGSIPLWVLPLAVPLSTPPLTLE